MLVRLDYDVTGFDPVYEGNNIRIQRRYFDQNIIGHAEGTILRHVLEHVQQPVDFLKQIKVANGGKGRIYIEVPCLDWICKYKAWFDIFYEHVNYFRLSDFKRMFGEIIASGYLFGEQYLYVVAELATLRGPEIDTNDRVLFLQTLFKVLLIR